MSRTAFVYDDRLSRHTLSDTHPMKPARLRYTYELLDSYGAFAAPDVDLVSSASASEADVLSHHSPEYVAAVQGLSRGDAATDPAAFNFGAGDNPYYDGMYDAAMLSTGASLRAAAMLLDGEHSRAFSISGGLHHAMPGYAFGFCVFNDPVIAIKSLLARGARVAYVDIDCHHGDGVQHAFYDTDRVLTISLHESGAFLFPGTGFTQEIGAGRGRGYSVNIPLYPYTSDEVYLWAFRQIVPRLLAAFRPDVLVTQLGIDTHVLDPITHLRLTTQGFAEAVGEFGKIAVPAWLALGGGGYDLQAVSRAWTLAFGQMAGQDLPDEVPESYRSRYGVDTLSDEPPEIQQSVASDTRVFAEASVQAVHSLVFPLHGIRFA